MADDLIVIALGLAAVPTWMVWALASVAAIVGAATVWAARQ